MLSIQYVYELSSLIFLAFPSSVALCVSGCKSRTFFLITKTFWNFFLRKFSSRFNQSIFLRTPSLAGCKDNIFIFYNPNLFESFFKVFRFRLKLKPLKIYITLNKELRLFCAQLLVDCGCKSTTFFQLSKPFYNLFLKFFVRLTFTGS